MGGNFYRFSTYIVLSFLIFGVEKHVAAVSAVETRLLEMLEVVVSKTISLLNRMLMQTNELYLIKTAFISVRENGVPYTVL